MLGGFNETELLKIWKGLHYCMWMQDKPLIQEELSTNISNLVHSFNNNGTALLFIKTFYITECREWFSIDKWRMDKFLMVSVVWCTIRCSYVLLLVALVSYLIFLQMFRDMLRQSLEFLKQNKWNEKLTRELLNFLRDYIILGTSYIWYNLLWSCGRVVLMKYDIMDILVGWF